MLSVNAYQKKNKKLKNPSESIVYILPLILAAAFVPMIVFYKYLPLDDLSKQYWPSNENIDFFSYYKSVFIMISAALALVIFLFRTYRQGICLKKVNIYIPVTVYCFFIILSAALSKYQIVSTKGFADRYEGVYVLLSYIVLMLAAINFLNSEKQIKIFLMLLFVSATIIGIIGLLQYFGLDLFQSTFGKLLILPAKEHSLAESLSFTFGKYTIYATLYNTNFVGSYTAMLFPMAYLLFLMVKRVAIKVLMGIFTILMYVNWLGCNSRGGYVGAAIAAVIAIVFLRKEILKNIKIILVSIVVFGLIFYTMNTVSGGTIVGRIFSETVGKPPQVQAFGFKDIEFEAKKISILGSKDNLVLELKENQLYFLDTNNKSLVFNTGEDGIISFSDERYQGISIYTENNLTNILFDNKQLSLQIDTSGFKIVGQKGILIDSLENTRRFGFEGKETLGSSRGYIWSRSIPLLKDNLFAGSGPDTYAFVFPQFDVVGKLKAFNRVNEIVDKPHDLYLQIGINTGVVSLIAVLALFAMYLFTCFKLYIRREFSNIYEVVGVVTFCAVCGYLTTAFFNDSLVSVAPVFWILLGLGISCNYYNMQKVVTTNKPVLEKKRGK